MRVKNTSICKSSFSSSDYEEDTVLIEGIGREFISLPDMKKIIENKKNEKNQKIKKKSRTRMG